MTDADFSAAEAYQDGGMEQWRARLFVHAAMDSLERALVALDRRDVERARQRVLDALRDCGVAYRGLKEGKGE